MKKIFYNFIFIPLFLSCGSKEDKNLQKNNQNQTDSLPTSSINKLDTSKVENDTTFYLSNDQQLLIGKGIPRLIRKNNYALLPEVSEAFEKMKKTAKKQALTYMSFLVIEILIIKKESGIGNLIQIVKI